MIDADSYEALRPYLFSIAYRMLGRASEAEDVVQDAWLRAATAATEADARAPRAFFATVVTRLCLDRLKSARARREEYVGPWLPEPVPTGDLLGRQDPAQVVERQDSVSLAFLVLLEQLGAAERAAFLLREVFGYEYADIAAILDRSEAASRQLVHRARQRLAAGRPRFAPADPHLHEELVSGFLAAARDADLGGLEQLLTRDARFVSDGGGKAVAVRKVIEGAHQVAALIAGFGRQLTSGSVPGPVRSAVVELNGTLALLIYEDERLGTVMVFSFAGDRIAEIQAVRNPDKLGWLEKRLRRG